MGVPKFYRWISERYPCLSQIVKDYQIPEFDNFYLDMNGIIHVCSHPNDDDPTFRIPESKIFSTIFSYLESLFRMIKPQKVLFLAVDGVAPRAKMNQQRGRRFRSAREAQDLIRKALQKGEVLPSEPRFDSNCITPGTEFMVRLHKQLKYFVNQKLATDPSWQRVEVILSGQDVPGEGEHKIMDYIRHQKSKADYDPNTRHCLYGLDADLMMLGLATHEPHFSLLREEVRFGKKSQKRQMTPDTITFHLLHLSIMREYIDFEFSPLREKLSFAYDLERIIDDWILMGFLVGNDFIPHLPNMHIRQEALPFLYQKYMEVLPTLDGYINEEGCLNMRRFEAYLLAISQFDRDHFNDLVTDLRWLEGKKGDGRRDKRGKRKEGQNGREGSAATATAEPSGAAEETGEKELENFFPAGLGDIGGEALEEGEEENSDAMLKLKRDFGISSLNTYFEEEDEDRVASFDKELTELKARYYHEKFGFVHVDDKVLLELAKCYVVGVQWVLHYYFAGVPSWSWYYPYHYAPFVSDIRGVADLHIEFDLCTPFFPFEQLLAVLPPASKSLLPKPFQTLMVNEDSTIKDYYPVNFDTDLNGKQHDWEAVVLIPFIDEEKLLVAMKPCRLLLTEDEASRNSYGTCLIYHFDPESEGTTFPSPWPQAFPDIPNCRVQVIELSDKPYLTARESIVWGLCKGVRLDVYFPGFPSLKHVEHTAQLEKKGVRVFQAASRGDNMCLSVLPLKDQPKDVYKLAQQLVGKTCYVGWPYLVEAKVSAISDGKTRYHVAQDSLQPKSSSRKPRPPTARIVGKVLGEGEVRVWHEEEKMCVRAYSERHGINVGPVDLLVYAQVLQGKRYVVDREGAKGTMVVEKQWSGHAEPYPYQTTIVDIAAAAPEFKESGITLEGLFPPKTQCFVMSPPHYGNLAEVLSVDSSQLRIQVKVKVFPEPDMSVVMGNRRLSVQYRPSYVVAKQLNIPNLVLARITSNIQVERGSRNNKKEREKLKVGLAWKFSKRNQELLGYARKTDDKWLFSPEAIKLLSEFVDSFPVMLSYVCQHPKEDSYYEDDLFPDPDGPESLSAVRDWLKQLPTHGMDAVDCGGQTLDDPQIAAIEGAVADLKRQTQRHPKAVKLRVKPSVLYKPMDHQGNLVPDPSADYLLFDRVVNVSTNNAVPFGLRGTVIGILGDGTENGSLYEVLFDEEFLGGLTLRCSPNRAYRLPPFCLLNISFGSRLETEKQLKQMKGRPSYVAAVQSNRGPPHSHPRHKYSYSPYPPPPYGHTPHYQEEPLDHMTYQSHRGRHSGEGGQKQVQIAKHGKKLESGRREEGGEPSAAASEFSSMMQEMEGHLTKPTSPKQSVPPSVKHTVLRYSQQSVSKHREPEPSVAPPPPDKKKEEDFSAAMDALSKLSISPRPGSTSTEGAQKPAGRGRGRGKAQQKSPGGAPFGDGFSPSVAAMFNAVSSERADKTAQTRIEDRKGQSHSESEDQSSALRTMLHIGEEPRKSLSPKHFEATKKVVQPPPHPLSVSPPQTHTLIRPPLLPYPGVTPFYPPVPIRGPPLLPHYSHHPPPHPPHPLPFGPRPLDPLTVLYQTAQSLGMPLPVVSAKEIEPGKYVGMVEVGQMKFKGSPCSTIEEAKQSVAAVANADCPYPHPRMPLLHYPRPMMLPHVPYGPPIPYPPPPGGLMRYPEPPPWFSAAPFHHPRGPRPLTRGRGIPQSFIPLQVQRRQAQKSPQPKPVYPRGGSKQQEVRSAGGGEPENAKRNLLQSLAAVTGDSRRPDCQDEIAAEVEPEQPPDIPTGKSLEDSEIAHQTSREIDGGPSEIVQQLETMIETNVETQARLEHLTQVAGTMELNGASIVEGEENVPVAASEGGRSQLAGDAVAQAAVLAVLDEGEEGSPGPFTEAFQPSDASTVSDSVHVVGEIVSAGDLVTSSVADVPTEDGVESAVDPLPHEDTVPSSSKRPKRQLAATFNT